jgi:hypothetical protein
MSMFLLAYVGLMRCGKAYINNRVVEFLKVNFKHMCMKLLLYAHIIFHHIFKIKFQIYFEFFSRFLSQTYVCVHN